MFEFKKRDERVSNVENRLSAIENRTLMLENDFQYRLGQFHKLISDMADMRDHVVKLEDELTIAKNLLITRKHAEIKKHEDPLVKVAPHDEVNSLEKQLADVRKELAAEKYTHYLTEKQLKNWLRKYKEDTGKDPITRNRRNRIDREKEAQIAELALTIQKEGIKDEHLPRP